MSIEVAHDHITIDNESAADAEGDAPRDDADYGFGLVLKLVDQLCRRLGWEYESSTRGDGRSTTIRFPASGAQPVSDDETPASDID